VSLLNFGGSGVSSHTEYKITTLTFEAVGVHQMSQFGTCLYSLWKAKFNGKKNGCVQIGSLKMFFQNFYYLWPQYVVCSKNIRIGIAVVVHWVGCVCNQS